MRHDWVHVRPGLAPNAVTSLIGYTALSCYWPKLKNLQAVEVFIIFCVDEEDSKNMILTSEKQIQDLIFVLRRISMWRGIKGGGNKTNLIWRGQMRVSQCLASNLAFEWCSHCGHQWEGTMNNGDGNVGAKRLIFLGWPALRKSQRAGQVADIPDSWLAWE